MERPEFKKMFDDNYSVVHLDVMENGDKKAKFENAGGIELMKELGGANSGLPFYVFLDAKGKKLADSNGMPKSMNIGYPGAPDEISAFMELIRKTAPRWSETDRQKLEAYFVTNAPKPAAGH